MNSMVVFILRRLVWLMVTLFFVAALMFGLSRMVPADPARLAMGEQATEDDIARMRELMGLDRPVHVQFFSYIGGLTRGDLGTSIRNQRPVLQDIRIYLPATLELALLATVMFVGLGIPLGVLAALNRGKPIDSFVRITSIVGVGMPSFWLALVLQVVMFKELGWFPSGGRVDPLLQQVPATTGLLLIDTAIAGDGRAFVSALHHLVLPAFTLMLGRLAITLRFARRSFLETASKDFVRTARSKGVREESVIRRHILRNSLIPVVTLLGLQLGQLLAGTVLVETVFSWPGIGKYAVDAISHLDYPAVMGVAIVITVVFVLANLAVDIVYTLLDPRIRY